MPKSLGDLLKYESPVSVTNLLARYPSSDQVVDLRYASGWLGFRVQDPKGKLRGYSDSYLQVLLWLTYGQKIPESIYRDYLYYVTPGASTEAHLDTGIVDLVTPYEVIEVKKAEHWKHALGQVLAYAHSTGKKPAVALIGSIPGVALQVFEQYGVRVIDLPF